jgi:hypothetical protein
MNDKELRRFIENLIIWHQGGEVSLPTREDRFIWNGILPVLELNEKKYIKSSGASRENGKLGGRPTKDGKTQLTQQVFEEPKKPDNSKELNVDRELVKVDSKKMNDESILKNVEGEMENVVCELTIGNSQKETGDFKNKEIKEIIDNQKSYSSNTGTSTAQYNRNKINELNSILENNYPQYPGLINLANPEGINEITIMIMDADEKKEILNILTTLYKLKKELNGNY